MPQQIALPPINGKKRSPKMNLKRLIATVAIVGAALGVAAPPALAAESGKKPNILFIMGDDIGWMQPSIYHRA